MRLLNLLLVIFLCHSCYASLHRQQQLHKYQHQKHSEELNNQSPKETEAELLGYLSENEIPDLDYILKTITGNNQRLYLEVTDKFDQHLSGAFDNFKCDTCLKIAPLFDYILSKPKLRKYIYTLSTTVCVLKEIFSSRVCLLGVQEWGPTVLYLADEYYLNSKEVCGMLLGDDCVEPVIAPANWTLNFPDKPKPAYLPPTHPPADAEFAKVLQLTDLHMDLSYLEGTNAQCEDPLCCRAIDGEPISYFYAAGKYGSVAYCDTPLITFESALEKLSKETFDWILVTGDLPAHDVYNQTREANLKIIKLVNSLLKKYFPNTPVLQTIGNHESAPVDQFIPPYMDPAKSPNPMSWLYEVLADEWSYWLPNSTRETILKGGYWSWEFTPGLKVISLNSGYGQTMDWYSRVNNTDYAGMLQWMINELQDLEDRNIKAWIMSHHYKFDVDYYKNMYDKIVERYTNVISGWYAGHSHRDYFDLKYDNTIQNGTLTPVLTAFVSPSITSYGGQNMAYRIYYVDAKRPNASFLAADHETHFLNVTKAKETGKIDWEFEYNIKKAYDMKGLLPADFDDLLTRMSTNTSLAESYLFYLTKSVEKQTCDLSCANSTADGLKRVMDPNLPTHFEESDQITVDPF